MQTVLAKYSFTITHDSVLIHPAFFCLTLQFVKFCRIRFAEAVYVESTVSGCCRQDLTWEELQPILLPAASEAEPASKPKRKLHPAETHMGRLQPKSAAQQAPATDAVPSTEQVLSKDASRKPAKPAQAGRRPAKAGSRSEAVPLEQEEQAVLAEAPTRADTPAGPRANTGNCPKAAAGCTPCSSAGKKPRVVIALGSMHTQEQQAYSSKLARIGVACVSHAQCPR